MERSPALIHAVGVGAAPVVVVVELDQVVLPAANLTDGVGARGWRNVLDGVEATAGARETGWQTPWLVHDLDRATGVREPWELSCDAARARE
jgi:hypothetical protein